MKTSPEELELQFLRTFKDYIYYFNMLERNVVYCLSYAIHGGDYNSKVDKFSRLSFDEKVRRLKVLIKKNEIENIFSKWFESIEYLRKKRNTLVHGQWDFRWWIEKPILFDIPAPMKEKGELTIDEFKKEFEVLKKVNQDFCDLREKYEIKEAVA
jgi:hypothetical protein